VPKHEINHRAGNPVQSDLRDFLLRFFKEKDVVKLERLGGRILISIAAPYVTRDHRNRKEVKIDDIFISALREARNNPEELHKQIAALSVKQLRELGKFLASPVRTKSPRETLVSELVAHFRSEDVWRRISQIQPDRAKATPPPDETLGY
jgi:hypothetical protein